MTVDFKNGYAVGLQADLGVYIEVPKTYVQDDIYVVDAPKIEMVYDADSFEVVDAPKIEMICICTEAEYDE